MNTRSFGSAILLIISSFLPASPAEAAPDRMFINGLWVNPADNFAVNDYLNYGEAVGDFLIYGYELIVIYSDEYNNGQTGVEYRYCNVGDDTCQGEGWVPTSNIVVDTSNYAGTEGDFRPGGAYPSQYRQGFYCAYGMSGCNDNTYSP